MRINGNGFTALCHAAKRGLVCRAACTKPLLAVRFAIFAKVKAQCGMVNLEIVMLAKEAASKLTYNVLGLCVVALSKNLKLTTTLDRAITQNPCYVPFFFTNQ